MLPPDSAFPSRAIAYALLSQTIWLPLVAIDLHDRWQARRDSQLETLAQAAAPAAAGLPGLAPLPDSPAIGAAPARPGSASSGLLLGASNGGVGAGAAAPGEEPVARSLDVARATPAGGAAAMPFKPFQLRPSSDLELLRGGFRPSELLGGPLGLADLQAPVMPGLAQAERARWASSGDPLAPLPSPWREPMRAAIRQLPGSGGGTGGSSSGGGVAGGGSPSRVAMARVVHVPSSRVRAAAEVPVALQSDGSVDILSQPGEAGVVEEIRDWSSQQQAPPPGQVAPAVVHLHPMPEAAPLRAETPDTAPAPAPAPAEAAAAPAATNP